MGLEPAWHTLGHSWRRKRSQCAVEWARNMHDQIAGQGVPFFFKQWGGIRPKAGGRALDEWNGDVIRRREPGSRLRWPQPLYTQDVGELTSTLSCYGITYRVSFASPAGTTTSSMWTGDTLAHGRAPTTIS